VWLTEQQFMVRKASSFVNVRCKHIVKHDEPGITGRADSGTG